jgi:hypothetical protein
MNDGEEIVWAERQFEIAVRRLHDRDDVPEDIPVVSRKLLDRLIDKYQKVSAQSRQFLASFSTSGDSLSQWRAYADDAMGFSVGFEPSCLDVPAPKWLVEYRLEAQQDYIMRAIAEVSQASKRSGYEPVNLDSDIMMLYHRMSCFKNPAFVDEREVRASHVTLLWKEANGSVTLNYCGGTVDGTEVTDAEIQFRARNGSIVPYIDFSFQLHSACAVREVWIGPRCPNSILDVQILLGTLGYEDVKVSVAGAKYRG